MDFGLESLSKQSDDVPMGVLELSRIWQADISGQLPGLKLQKGSDGLFSPKKLHGGGGEGDQL